MARAVRRYTASELSRRLGVTEREIEARCTPWRTPGAREVLVRGVGWFAPIDLEAKALGLRVVDIGEPFLVRRQGVADQV